MIPSALEHVQDIAGGNRQLAVFLDYDGTLTPIVSHPEKALLSDSTRQTLQALAVAEKELREKLAGIADALVERKRFSIATHYRKLNENDFPKLERVVSEVAARHRELRRMEGKKVYELLPRTDWDKG